MRRPDVVAELEAQRDDALAYLSAMRGVLDAIAGDHDVPAAAQLIAATIVRELAVESCAVCLREPGGPLAVRGFASQGERFGDDLDDRAAEAGLVSLARLVGDAGVPAAFRRTADGGFTTVGVGELAGEGCVVLPFACADARGGLLLLHWLVVPEAHLARSPALSLLAEAVGSVLASAQAREAGRRLTTQLERELGAARTAVTMQADHLRTRADRIETLTAELIRSNRVKTEFLATVSHELRTPLNAILGYGALLREGVGGTLSGDQLRMLDRVLGSSQHLHALIDDVLFIVDCDADRILATPEPVDTQELVDGVLGALPDRPPATEVALDVRVGREAARLVTDARLVKRILFHLLRNAFKFTSRGQVRLDVDVDDARDALVITVADTGTGIAPEKREAIFDLFTQGDGSDRRRFEGLGLGLTLVRRCARLLGGEVVVDSTPDEGSTFRVVLPRTQTATAAVRRRAAVGGMAARALP